MVSLFSWAFWKISKFFGTSWKVGQNFQPKFSNRRYVSVYIFMDDFASLQALSVNLNEFCEWYMYTPGPIRTEFPIPQFLLTIWRNQFLRVNKQHRKWHHVIGIFEMADPRGMFSHDQNFWTTDWNQWSLNWAEKKLLSTNMWDR